MKKILKAIFFILGLMTMAKCENPNLGQEFVFVPMFEKQITFSQKTHALDQNDNFSPDGKSLCYDTRSTVYNSNLANSKSIEKVDINTGEETILWAPSHITGENAAPGVAAVSYHPKINKVIFIHGPFIEEVEKRGYYNIRNRTAIEVDANGEGIINKVDMRDISNNVTTPGAHRGGTHRHEYTRSGNRIGFTYDDYIVQKYDRTIGYMEKNENSPEGYTHYFSLILKPVEKGSSKPGEIEKAFNDSWVDSLGTMRAFIGKVRNKNGVDYDCDIFVADIPLDINITTSFSGNRNGYPRPANGINIRRLTSGLKADGIVRGSVDVKNIVFTAEDKNGIKQLYLLKSDGSQKIPEKVSNLTKDALSARWHPSGNYIFFLSGGDIFIAYVGFEKKMGKIFKLTDGKIERTQLVVSPDGNILAYCVPTATKDSNSKIVKDVTDNDYKQIFVMELDWEKILKEL